ncbi:hypothetical protein [Nonomuraea rhodomycinica]|uniref:hypothetical protein n=1 Tax=Nonomuraea rhodomycinica TaxID=1712872 RepID=UPI001C3792AD|nr:hypothetical protein [Nonomuraea rhodomycinica]
MPHVVLQNNLMATFNALEAAVRFGATRFVNISSETVPGYFFCERPFLPDHAPVDEDHPIRPKRSWRDYLDEDGRALWLPLACPRVAARARGPRRGVRPW